jgi:hypothetical protein
MLSAFYQPTRQTLDRANSFWLLSSCVALLDDEQILVQPFSEVVTTVIFAKRNKLMLLSEGQGLAKTYGSTA